MNFKNDSTPASMNKKNITEILKDIKKGQKRPDGIFGSFMTRPVSHVAAYLFYRIHLTPNMVTFISFLLCLTSCLSLLMLKKNYTLYIFAALVWWGGAILDAADGDLARYTNKGSQFGGWFDSYLDRLKEFIIFGTLGYLAFKGYGLSSWGNILEIEFGNEVFLFLGFLSILSNVMSGWISDTKKLFTNGERAVEMKLSERYMFGMVDTRDFFVILSLCLSEFRIALFIYGVVFPFVLMMQTGLFLRRYGQGK
jgi:phosphatidylglycerophosphate synthase